VSRDIQPFKEAPAGEWHGHILVCGKRPSLFWQ